MAAAISTALLSGLCSFWTPVHRDRNKRFFGPRDSPPNNQRKPIRLSICHDRRRPAHRRFSHLPERPQFSGIGFQPCCTPARSSPLWRFLFRPVGAAGGAARGDSQHLPADAVTGPQHSRLHAVSGNGHSSVHPGGDGDRHRHLPHFRRAQQRRVHAAGDRRGARNWYGGSRGRDELHR